MRRAAWLIVIAACAMVAFCVEWLREHAEQQLKGAKEKEAEK